MRFVALISTLALFMPALALADGFENDYGSGKTSAQRKEKIQVDQPTFGLSTGIGLTPLPTWRLEFGWHTRWDLGFVSAGFESSSFSRNHWLAKTMLLDTYAKDVQSRRVLLNWRAPGDIYVTSGLGYENQFFKLLVPAAKESKELKRAINADQQSFLFNAGLESCGRYEHVRLVMEWVGITFRSRVRDTNFSERAADVTAEEVDKAKSDLLNEAKTGYRFLNLGVFVDF